MGTFSIMYYYNSICYELLKIVCFLLTSIFFFYVFLAGGRRKHEDSFGEACVEENNSASVTNR